MIDQILSSSDKPKQKLLKLSEALLSKQISVDDLVQYFGDTDDAKKGYVMEALEYASASNPELIEPIIDFIIENIIFDAPRVKWESARVIANIAEKYPDKVENTIDNLIINTKDKGTVVRWSAAFALTRIATSNEHTRAKLEPVFEKLLEIEDNKGVRNHYEKYFKHIK